MFKKLFGARTSKESTKKGVLEKKGAIELQLEALQKKQTQHEKQVEQQIKLAKEALSKGDRASKIPIQMLIVN
jgi:hypothetical protein